MNIFSEYNFFYSFSPFLGRKVVTFGELCTTDQVAEQLLQYLLHLTDAIPGTCPVYPSTMTPPFISQAYSSPRRWCCLMRFPLRETQLLLQQHRKGQDCPPLFLRNSYHNPAMYICIETVVDDRAVCTPVGLGPKGPPSLATYAATYVAMIYTSSSGLWTAVPFSAASSTPSWSGKAYSVFSASRVTEQTGWFLTQPRHTY